MIRSTRSIEIQVPSLVELATQKFCMGVCGYIYDYGEPSTPTPNDQNIITKEIINTPGKRTKVRVKKLHVQRTKVTAKKPHRFRPKYLHVEKESMNCLPPEIFHLIQEMCIMYSGNNVLFSLTLNERTTSLDLSYSDLYREENLESILKYCSNSLEELNLRRLVYDRPFCLIK